jgi:putative addiction module killer protein
MNEIKQTEVFAQWIAGLKDLSGRARILGRITRARLGHLGDVKYFGGIGELRIDAGPGHRVYFARAGKTVYLLLNGGDKASQPADIERSKALWAAIKGKRETVQ